LSTRFQTTFGLKRHSSLKGGITSKFELTSSSKQLEENLLKMIENVERKRTETIINLSKNHLYRQPILESLQESKAN
jgi:hypothetical protein